MAPEARTRWPRQPPDQQAPGQWEKNSLTLVTASRLRQDREAGDLKEARLIPLRLCRGFSHSSVNALRTWTSAHCGALGGSLPAALIFQPRSKAEAHRGEKRLREPSWQSGTLQSQPPDPRPSLSLTARAGCKSNPFRLLVRQTQRGSASGRACGQPTGKWRPPGNSDTESRCPGHQHPA